MTVVSILISTLIFTVALPGVAHEKILRSRVHRLLNHKSRLHILRTKRSTPKKRAFEVSHDGVPSLKKREKGRTDDSRHARLETTGDYYSHKHAGLGASVKHRLGRKRGPARAYDDGVSPPRIDIYIVAAGNALGKYKATTLPRWRSFAELRGYGFHVVRNGTICARHLNLSEFSSWSQVNWARICLAKELLSPTLGKESLAAFDVDAPLDVLAQNSDEGLDISRDSYVLFIDADVLVQDPRFDLVSTMMPFFSNGTAVVMLEDRSSSHDMGCFGNGHPKGSQYSGWAEGVCLPQGSFAMYKRGNLALKFINQWINDARAGPCAQEARRGSYPEQNTLKNCTIPTVLKESPNLLRVVNGHEAIMTNELDVNFPALAHFPLGLKTTIPEYFDATQTKFTQSGN